eukprot:6017655-Prymnesium_polylepis.1
MLAAAVGVTAVSLALLPCYLRRPGRLPWRAAMSATASGQRGQYLDSVSKAAAALREGQLCAFPTETVYGLGANALDAAACARIFEVKGRPRSDPLIVHVPSPEAAERLVRLEPEGLALLRRLAESFWPGPLTLVAPACDELPVEVTSGSGFVGVRCPKHALAIELLREARVPVAAPSANRFGHVSPTRPEHVMDDLGAHAIFVLRQAADEGCCDVGIESTVLKVPKHPSEPLDAPNSKAPTVIPDPPTSVHLMRQRGLLAQCGIPPSRFHWRASATATLAGRPGEPIADPAAARRRAGGGARALGRGGGLRLLVRRAGGAQGAHAGRARRAARRARCRRRGRAARRAADGARDAAHALRARRAVLPLLRGRGGGRGGGRGVDLARRRRRHPRLWRPPRFAAQPRVCVSRPVACRRRERGVHGAL